MNGLGQPLPIEFGGSCLEALVGLTLCNGQEQGARQAEAVEIAHHDITLIMAQPLLQLGQRQPLLPAPFIPDFKHMRALLAIRGIHCFEKAGAGQLSDLTVSNDHWP